MLSAQFQLTEQDYLAFLRLHDRAYTVPIFGILGVGCAIEAGIGWYTDDMRFALSAIALALLVTVVGRYLRYAFFLPRHTAKIWREYALIKEEVTLILTDDGFHYGQPSAHVDVKWANVLKWDEDEAIFAVYATRQLAYIFPKAACHVILLVVARDGLLGSGLVQKGKPRK